MSPAHYDRINATISSPYTSRYSRSHRCITVVKLRGRSIHQTSSAYHLLMRSRVVICWLSGPTSNTDSPSLFTCAIDVRALFLSPRYLKFEMIPIRRSTVLSGNSRKGPVKSRIHRQRQTSLLLTGLYEDHSQQTIAEFKISFGKFFGFTPVTFFQSKPKST